MALRPRAPTFRAQPPLQPLYEYFQPKSEMKENDEAHLLHVYLPGFIKERITINFVGSSRVLRVRGERSIDGGNRWSRFEQTYPVPENCEVEKLEGKFERGILIVTMPKKLISQVTPKAKVEKTQEKGPSPSKKVVTEPEPKIAEEAIPPKSTTTPSIVKGSTDLKGTQKDTPLAQNDKGLRTLNLSEPVLEPRPQNVKEETALKSTTVAATPKEQKGMPQKGQEEIEPKPTLTMDSRKKINENLEEDIRQKTILATVKKQLHEEAEKEGVTKKEVKEEDEKPYETRKPEKVMDQNVVFKGKEIRARKESPKEAKYSAKKEDEIYTIGKGIKELAASSSRLVTSIGEGKLNEQDKPLVANMGAAILVIVALGTYVAYKLASSGRTEN
ncbi:inactive protein RESTRICTED TEV MOVEMENT 2-like [Gastrolobium bilobum]|uniref:inactive protein RESTRICTED TEV MOVEMENT 2-like n=1 Tax=Gastrolobium bilobum TaxID=150636 RepID=UPI002AB1F139|nr:inactive protein RESTRICTED TEV MOVEMENT 2-like [Gastrolobium bilobum]